MDKVKWLWGSRTSGIRGLSSPHKTMEFIGVGDAAIAERVYSLLLTSAYDDRVPQKRPVAVEIPGAKGIDSVAITISHEFKHIAIYGQWGQRIGFTGPGHSDTDGIPDNVEDDRTPNSLGEIYRFNSRDPDCYRMHRYYPEKTHYATYGDNELLARVEGIYNPRATSPGKDWSKGGKQWGR
ncbi:MAG: hypothetical protein QHH07_12700 [Sedimentisphaerales bacterium]|nr:hypothetical protein [Sedimentisphaerales bacterium]